MFVYWRFYILMIKDIEMIYDDPVIIMYSWLRLNVLACWAYLLQIYTSFNMATLDISEHS